MFSRKWSLLNQALAALAVAVGLLASAPSLAQTAAQSGLSQQQFDALVRSVSEAVVRQLAEKGAIPPAAGNKAEPKKESAEPKKEAAEAEAEPSEGTTDAIEKGFSKGAGTFLKRLQATIEIYPRFGVTFQQIGDALHKSGSRPFGDFITLIFAALASALVAEYLIRLVLARVAARSAGQALMVDLAALASVIGIAHGFDGVLITGNDLQSRLAELSSVALVTWRLFAFAFRLVLRPGQAALRMARISDDAAKRLFLFFSIASGVILLARLWGRLGRAAGVTPDAQLATTLASILIVTLIMVLGFRAVRHAMTAWLQSLIEPSATGHKIKQAIALHWSGAASVFYVATSLSYAYGAVIGRHGIGTGVNHTLIALGGLLFIETAIDYFTGWKPEPATAPAGKLVEPRAIDVVGKCLRVAARIGVLALLFESWAVKSLGLMTEAEWLKLVHAVNDAAIALFGAYAAWQTLLFFIRRYEARNPVIIGTGDGDGDGEQPPATASRLRTLMPVLKVTLGALILVVAVLLALSEMGVNIAPLLAGASIFGLAISFGSQSLVRDIVSGVFYLADDAFRIGEYIDTGKQKGTVEGFTLRSIKLRHQNGQMHTIPFGQLGSVTNFSRDWTTIKFNLRFATGTDLELLRKTTKKIGQEMMEDPELKNEFLEPLKMQGIADIADNAIVARFKMTLRPVKPTFVQRQAVKRMYKIFPEKGIEFAKATVSVQTVGGAPIDPALLGAAASAGSSSVPPASQ